jgi:outer membrane protein assembly factor BamE
MTLIDSPRINWLALTRLGRQGLLSLLVLAFAACSTYKPDVVQGNIVTQQQLELLRPGLSRQQVQQALGSPLLQDVFNSQRWDYIYRTQSGKGAVEQRVLTVFFDAQNKLSHWTGQVAPAHAAGKGAPNMAAAPAASDTVSAPASSNTSLTTSTPSLPMVPAADGVSLKTGSPSAAPVPGAATMAVNTANASTINSQAPAPVLATTAAPVNPPRNVSNNAAEKAPGNAAPGAAVSQVQPSRLVVDPVVIGAQSNPVILKNIQARVESWRKAWEDKNIDRYAAHYAANYQADFASRAAWLSQRKKTMKEAGAITLNLSNVKIIQTSPTEARARFTQQYQSRRFKDFGDKDLFFALENGQWNIVAERFVK